MESPLQLICRLLPRYWNTRRRLRCVSDDPQICGYEYCAEGAIADIYLKHCPKAKEINARWEHNQFAWGNKKEACWLPQPVIDWINEYHGSGTGETLRGNLAAMNDSGANLDTIAQIIGLNFGLYRLKLNPASTLKPVPTI